MKKIRVIVVDDSALMRKIISDMINSEDDMEVVDIAKNGQELLNKISNSTPQVITLDVEMPIMDGMTALKELKRSYKNIPVIMLSSISQKGTQLTMECLESGAFDFIPKPSGAISLDINKVKDELVQKIRIACDKNITSDAIKEGKPQMPMERTYQRNYISKLKNDKIESVVIGASTGGPKALYTVITALPANLGVPVFVVQHMPVGFTKAFADRLNANSDIKVVEASENMPVERNVVYIAPGGYHMEIGLDKKIHLNLEPAIWGVRPAVDKLFISASKVYGSRIVSAVLTGMGKDGAQGTVEIKKHGGITLSEDKSTCTIYGMPKAAFETGMVDAVLPLEEIAIQIIKLVSGGGR
ncbi:protein-glutamate methylesterase/protein-glutamine glutaminase [Clostridium omnivorum]|uniref:Protein-glutamate methylesterase/protein-glutamine glutaminase n=1 Tax=Clostridium omnivorum TaxID=1604902 RepID=A0ABQ5NAS1_9CLOT|nr:chemotaxis response regulator protein-glutamate methylesterase [Clostridium sp. E14]GLC32313.1 chemotaxis response regulator protein-glutamate methylesterase [Clostridium sp. E14]